MTGHRGDVGIEIAPETAGETALGCGGPVRSVRGWRDGACGAA